MSAAESVRSALRWRVPISDQEFDALYPEHIRLLSNVHWTPVEVALRAAALLVPEPGLKVLDVGSGAGKVCCIGALSARSTWHGIERDPRLVATARRMAKQLDVSERTKFHIGDMATVNWAEYDSIYFFNPFERLLFAPPPIEPRLRWTLFGNEVSRAEERLATLAPGTRVVTYHGFGGEMPSSYRLSGMERIGSDQLALWIKKPNAPAARLPAPEPPTE
jgi:hypothetical protein